ncbi:pygopus homolog 1 [Misgurnus anguillicaudatus]|uniref:pygopus homolog 1 n=1 Tax=Misgurnus anguillicaudatus TaxID=75329 RepID=UPI003CCFC135
MSTEQDKDSFSLKRNRGVDGGLDILGSPGLLLGSPEKKRRKSSTQAPSFSPLSEYAPPLNPSSDHLIAANPFDDNYSLPSLKPLSSVNPYFGHSHHHGFSGYGPPRMAPQMGNRMPFPYGSPYQMRNQTQPFSQNPMVMGLNRAPGFNYRHPENPNYGHQFGGGMQLSPVQPFRPGLGENVNQMPLQNRNFRSSPDCGPEENSASSKTGLDMSPKFSRQQNKSRTSTPKQDPSETFSRNATQIPSPRKQNHNYEGGASHDSAIELKAKGRGNTPAAVEKLNGVLHPNNDPQKNSPRPAASDKVRRGNGNGSAPLPNNKVHSRSNRRSTSSEPVYPCGICLNEVNDDQEAILCEASCQKWFHRVCTGMTETAYNLLTAEMSAVWGCDACMEDKEAQLLKTRDDPGTPSVTNDGQS